MISQAANCKSYRLLACDASSYVDRYRRVRETAAVVFRINKPTYRQREQVLPKRHTLENISLQYIK